MTYLKKALTADTAVHFIALAGGIVNYITTGLIVGVLAFLYIELTVMKLHTQGVRGIGKAIAYILLLNCAILLIVLLGFSITTSSYIGYAIVLALIYYD